MPRIRYALPKAMTRQRERERLYATAREASLANLEIARVRHRSWRPWRSPQESLQIRYLVWQWFIYPWQKWSARKLALRLGVHRHWVQKLVGEFRRDPGRIRREVRESGYRVATFKQLEEAREVTRQMRVAGQLRPFEWRVRIRDLVERAERLEVEGVRKPYIPESVKWWPKRAVWKTVRAWGNTRAFSSKIPKEIPPWAVSEYSMMVANYFG